MDSEKKSKSTNAPSCSEGKISVPTIAAHPNSNEVLIKDAIETIGMGRYQWHLMLSCRFGFVVDQMLLVSISLVMPQASKEFGPQYATLLSATQYAGLGVGAIAFGLLADFAGRRLAWQTSIFGVSIFTAVCAASPTWAALNGFVAVTAFFGGGNLAIDLTVLAECLPRKWGFLLSGLACLWGLGSAITGLIAWPLVVNFCCPQGAKPATCGKSDNMGWRYLYIILGVLCFIMSILRTFALRMAESPKWLISQGRGDEAVASINTISRVNKSTYTISSSELHEEQAESRKNVKTVLRMIADLLRGKNQALSMICLILIWLLVGIAYPVYQVFLAYYLEAHGVKLGNEACIKRIATVFAGRFTTVKNEAQNLALSSMINFFVNAMYGVVYGYTPEVLSDTHRGIGCGLTLACGRVVSLTAPFIATWGDVYSSVPIFVCCGLFVAIGIVSLILPFEPMDIGG